MTDPTEIKANEFHPAARQAYRWLKGFMITNTADYSRYRTALEIAAASHNRQAEICMGTINRLKAGQPVSDRYLLGLCWTILSLYQKDDIETIAGARLDKAYPEDETEYKS